MEANQSAPLVSIIIPTFNRGPLLKNALESVRAQSFSNWEAIIIDEGSTDNTSDLIKNFNDHRIRLISYKCRGILAAARNRGIQVARGEFIAFLDSDDIWYPNKLAKCLEVISPSIDLVAHGLVHLKNDKIIKKKLCGHKNRCMTYEKMLYSGVTCLTTSAVFVRMSSLEKVSGFYEDRYETTNDIKIGNVFEGGPIHLGAEDYDLWLRLAKNGMGFYFIEEVLGEYYIHAEQSSRAARCRLASQLAVLERHFGSNEGITLHEWIKRKKRQAKAFYMIGRGVQEDGRKHEALLLYSQSAQIWPFNIKLYIAFLFTLMGIKTL